MNSFVFGAHQRLQGLEGVTAPEDPCWGEITFHGPRAGFQVTWKDLFSSLKMKRQVTRPTLSPPLSFINYAAVRLAWVSDSTGRVGGAETRPVPSAASETRKAR